jgi:two-component system cell cycle sensor histidine kinase PleC
MAQAKERPATTGTDPRILQVQVERAAKTIRGTIASSPLWVVFIALLTSDRMPLLGSVPSLRAVSFVGIVFAAILSAYFILQLYYRSREAGLSPDAVARWLQRFFFVSIGLSTAWGLAPWFLWDERDPVNHVFIALVGLAVIARYVVHRANHLSFFLGTFLPLAILLVARLVLEFQAMELVLAAMVPLYAIQTVTDSSNISQRWDQEAATRFSFEDISRELEEARDEALMKRAEAESANRSKTQFLANMSHELRTPLNAILGFSDIIAREYLGPVGSPRYKEYAGDIHQSGTHLLSLINDLLDVAKIEAGRMEIEPHMVETKRALDSALKFVGAKARERNQTLAISIDEGARILYADERALKQIVINLVSNAVKFSPESGRIEVVAKPDAQGNFELMVADNGPGVPKAKLDRIFKPFGRVDNRYDAQAGGTGLGLSLVRGLAELHGGRAWIESEEGKGTRAFVMLPMASASPDIGKSKPDVRIKGAA